MKHLSDIQIGFLKRLMGKVLDFVPVPSPVGGSDEIRQWCHDICAAETLREVAQRWAKCVKDLGEYLLTVGLTETLRQRMPSTPSGLLVVDFKTVEELAGAILCLAVDEAEGDDIFRHARVAVQLGKQFPDTERERAARQVVDAWQIVDVLGNMLVVDEDTLRRFKRALRDVVESLLSSASVSASPDISALGSEVAALLQRVAETERRLLENWRAQLAPVLSPRRGQRLNDEAEAIAVHLAQLFAVPSITSEELYGYLRSRHHWTPDTFAGLTDKQIFNAIEREVRLVLDSYAGLPVPSHVLNVPPARESGATLNHYEQHSIMSTERARPELDPYLLRCIRELREAMRPCLFQEDAAAYQYFSGIWYRQLELCLQALRAGGRNFTGTPTVRRSLSDLQSCYDYHKSRAESTSEPDAATDTRIEKLFRKALKRLERALQKEEARTEQLPLPASVPESCNTITTGLLAVRY